MDTAGRDRCGLVLLWAQLGEMGLDWYSCGHSGERWVWTSIPVAIAGRDGYELVILWGQWAEMGMD